MRPEDTSKNIFWPILCINDAVNSGTNTLTPATIYPMSIIEEEIFSISRDFSISPAVDVVSELWPSWRFDLSKNVMLSKPVRDVNVIIVTAVIKGCSTDLSKDTKTIYKKLFFRKLFYTMIGKQEKFVLKKTPFKSNFLIHILE